MNAPGPPTIDVQDFLARAGTGDVVLWIGTSLESFEVEMASFSVYSHATMIITEPKSGDKYLFQSVSEALEPDPLSRQDVVTHDGVQAGALEATMRKVYGYGDFPTWRRFVWPDRPEDFDQQVWDTARSLDGIRFPSGMLELAGLLFLGRYAPVPVEVPEPLFCSGLVARMLQTVGVIAKDRPWNGYEPKDFSSLYPGGLTVAAGSYDDDVVVVIPSD